MADIAQIYGLKLDEPLSRLSSLQLLFRKNGVYR